jgi:hypothetical protein
MGILRIVPVVLLAAFIAFGPGLMSAATHSPLPTFAAEAAPVGPVTMDWQGILGTAGVTGVLVWYLYYTTSFAFPKVRQDFREELAAQRAHDEETMARRDAQMEKLCTELSSLATQLSRRPCIRVGEGEA